MGTRAKVAGSVGAAGAFGLVAKFVFEAYLNAEDGRVIGDFARFLADPPPFFVLGVLLFSLWALWVYQYNGILEVREEYETERRTANLDFANFVTEQISSATVNLLNRVVDVSGGDGAGLHSWQVDEAKWRESVLRRMREHGCPAQEVQRIEILIQYPTIAADSDPAMNAQKSILAERLGRLRELAERYSDVWLGD